MTGRHSRYNSKVCFNFINLVQYNVCSSVSINCDFDKLLQRRQKRMCRTIQQTTSANIKMTWKRMSSVFSIKNMVIKPSVTIYQSARHATAFCTSGWHCMKKVSHMLICCHFLEMCNRYIYVSIAVTFAY